MASKTIQTSIIKIDNQKLDFETILLSDLINNRPITQFGRTIELKYVEDKPNYILGVMVTTKREGIPPKHKTSNDLYSPLDLDDDEGLAYANVFLYDKGTKILMYEFNKNGVYLQKFCDHLRMLTNSTEEFGVFNITPEPLLNIEAYNRMIQMNFYKSIEIQIAQPDILINDFKDKNDSLKNILKFGKEINSNYLTIILDVKQRRKEGLFNNIVQRVTNTLMSLGGKKDDEDLIKKVEITGYENDPDDPNSNVKSIVDLVLDKYKCTMVIEEKRILKDLQIQDRKTAIQELYNKNVAEYKKIVSIQKKHKLN
jgi:hypothetical protein